jgi:hypothetical protein
VTLLPHLLKVVSSEVDLVVVVVADVVTDEVAVVVVADVVMLTSSPGSP